MKYSIVIADNAKLPGAAGAKSAVHGSISRAKADVNHRDSGPGSSRPNTAMPRYMQGTTVSRQRTLFLGRTLSDSDDHTPFRQLTKSSHGKAEEQNQVQRNRPRAQSNADGNAGGLRGFGIPSTDRGHQKVEPLLATRRPSLPKDVKEDTAREHIVAVDLETGLIVDEATVSLVPSRKSSTVDQNSVISGRIRSAFGIHQSPADTDAQSVRLPDIGLRPSLSGLRRVSSEFQVLINEANLFSDKEPKQDQWTEELSFREECATDRLEETQVDNRVSAINRSMPSATLSSGSSQNASIHQLPHPQKMKNTTTCDAENDNLAAGSPPYTAFDEVFNLPSARQTTTTTTTTTRDEEARNQRKSIGSTGEHHLVESKARNGNDIMLQLPSTQNRMPDVTGSAHPNELKQTLSKNNLERLQQNPATPRVYDPNHHHQQQSNERKAGLIDGGLRKRHTAAALRDSGVQGQTAAQRSGLLRPSKSQPNLIGFQRNNRAPMKPRQSHQEQSRPTGHAHGHQHGQTHTKHQTRKTLPTKDYDYNNNDDDGYDDDDEDDDDDEGVAVGKMKKERIVQWLLETVDCAEPPPCATPIEDDKPPQTDNAIHIVYAGGDEIV